MAALADADNKDDSSRTGLWVHPYNPCLPSPNSRTCPASLIRSQPAWRPFAKDANDVPKPRWPLYGVINGSGVGDDISDVVWDPHDEEDPDTDPDVAVDVSTPELWSPPFGLTQSIRRCTRCPAASSRGRRAGRLTRRDPPGRAPSSLGGRAPARRA